MIWLVFIKSQRKVRLSLGLIRIISECRKRIKRASILYVLEKTGIKQTIKEPKFLKKLWSCDGMYERWKLHRPSMKTVLSKGGYDDYSIKRLLLTLNWLIKPSFTMFLSINTEFRVDWKRKRVSEIEWHILTLPLMMPQRKAINDDRFVYNPTRYFS